MKHGGPRRTGGAGARHAASTPGSSRSSTGAGICAEGVLRQQMTRAQLSRIHGALDVYRLERGRRPPSLEALVERGAPTPGERRCVSPWTDRYYYRRVGTPGVHPPAPAPALAFSGVSSSAGKDGVAYRFVRETAPGSPPPGWTCGTTTVAPRRLRAPRREPPRPSSGGWSVGWANGEPTIAPRRCARRGRLRRCAWSEQLETILTPRGAPGGPGGRLSRACKLLGRATKPEETLDSLVLGPVLSRGGRHVSPKTARRRPTSRPSASTTSCSASVRPGRGRPTWPWRWRSRPSDAEGEAHHPRPSGGRGGEKLGFLPGDLAEKVESLPPSALSTRSTT